MGLCEVIKCGKGFNRQKSLKSTALQYGACINVCVYLEREREGGDQVHAHTDMHMHIYAYICMHACTVCVRVCVRALVSVIHHLLRLLNLKH